MKRQRDQNDDDYGREPKRQECAYNQFPLKVDKAIKDDPVIEQPLAAKLGIVPEVAFRWMFSGPSNSGKTNLARWCLDKYYQGKNGGSFFDRIYLFSPTAKLDPVWKDLEGLRPGDRITELKNGGAERLRAIFDKGVRRCKAMGKENAPHELVILDDVIAQTQFLNAEDFLNLFAAGRHGNISIFVMTQSYIKIPRSVRMNITALAMFPSRDTEIIRLHQEHGPIKMNKKQFIRMVKHAINKTDEEKYPFLFLDTMRPEDLRFRRCLSEHLVPTGDPPDGADDISDRRDAPDQRKRKTTRSPLQCDIDPGERDTEKMNSRPSQRKRQKKCQ